MTASPAGRQIGLHREMPHPGVGLGHRHNRPGLQGVGVGFEDGEEPAEHPLRPHVPQPEDDDARSGGAGNGNQVREVEVVGDNDSRLGARASRSRDPSAGNHPGRRDARRHAPRSASLRQSWLRSPCRTAASCRGCLARQYRLLREPSDVVQCLGDVVWLQARILRQDLARCHPRGDQVNEECDADP